MREERRREVGYFHPAVGASGSIEETREISSRRIRPRPGARRAIRDARAKKRSRRASTDHFPRAIRRESRASRDATREARVANARMKLSLKTAIDRATGVAAREEARAHAP
jgi:hypothetical protein